MVTSAVCDPQPVIHVNVDERPALTEAAYRLIECGRSTTRAIALRSTMKSLISEATFQKTRMGRRTSIPQPRLPDQDLHRETKAASARQLVCQYAGASDVQRAFQQIGGAGTKGGGDLAIYMGLTASFVIERVKNCEGLLVEPDCKPSDRLGLT